MGGNLQFSLAYRNAKSPAKTIGRALAEQKKPDKPKHQPLAEVIQFPGSKTKNENNTATAPSSPFQKMASTWNFMIIQMFYYAKSVRGRGFAARDGTTVSCGYWAVRPEYRHVMQAKKSDTTEEMLNTLIGYTQQVAALRGLGEGLESPLSRLHLLDSEDSMVFGNGPLSLRLLSLLSSHSSLSSEIFETLSIRELSTLLHAIECAFRSESAANPELAMHFVSLIEENPYLFAFGSSSSNALLHSFEFNAGFGLEEHVLPYYTLSLASSLAFSHQSHESEHDEEYAEHSDDTGSYGRHVAEWFWAMHSHDPGAHISGPHEDVDEGEYESHGSHNARPETHDSGHHEHRHRSHHVHHEHQGSHGNTSHHEQGSHHFHHEDSHHPHHVHHETHHSHQESTHHGYQHLHGHHLHHEHTHHGHSDHGNNIHHSPHHAHSSHGAAHAEDGHFMSHLDNAQADKWWMYRGGSGHSHHGGSHPTHGIQHATHSNQHTVHSSNGHTIHKPASAMVGIEYKLGFEQRTTMKVASASQPTE